MKLEEIYSITEAKKPVISFEVFPPKEEHDIRNKLIIDELNKLSSFNPKLVSITYGAGGTTKTNSLQLAKVIRDSLKIDVMPHFTCKNSSKEFIQSYLSEIEEESMHNVLALRGDVPIGEDILCEDFRYASELVEFIKSKTDLSIAVAGYPEAHIEADDLASDIENLKKKVNAGAKVIFTQLFFDNEYFYHYCEKVRDAGIDIPIVPGILPITSYNQLSKMISLCKVKLPNSLKDKLEQYRHDQDSVKIIGKEFAIIQSQKLIDFGVSGLHFYILNKSMPAYDILENIL